MNNYLSKKGGFSLVRFYKSIYLIKNRKKIFNNIDLKSIRINVGKNIR